VGQITIPSAPGITVNPIDRESGPGAGPGATGNNSIFLGLNAGKNSSISNFIAIGNNAGAAGIVDANLNGTVLIGTGNATSLTHSDGNATPVTIVGHGNLATAADVDSTTILGANNFGNWENVLFNNVIVGQNIFPTSNSLGIGGNNSVLIGSAIGSTVTAGNIGAAQSSIIIGVNIQGTVAETFFNSSIVIGVNLTGPSNMATCIALGNNMALSSQPGSSILIGHNITMNGPANDDDRNVGIGQGVTITGVQNVVLGYGAASPAPATATFGNVIIGTNAGQSLGAGTQGVLVIEQTTTGLGTGVLGLVYGDFTKGNIVLGNSATGTNRDFGGAAATNVVKLLNGTIGGVNPVGGGYFYVSAGVLHWVDSTGIDSQLSENVQGQLASSALHAFTNNAAANAGTLTNAPAVGNPTKWIPINDAGTIRNIPAW
jgi:hypothetical protein